MKNILTSVIATAAVGVLCIPIMCLYAYAGLKVWTWHFVSHGAPAVTFTQAVMFWLLIGMLKLRVPGKTKDEMDTAETLGSLFGLILVPLLLLLVGWVLT